MRPTIAGPTRTQPVPSQPPHPMRFLLTLPESDRDGGVLNRIDLMWGAATDNAGVTAYRVERCQGPGCSSFAQIATTTGTTLANTGLTASTSYTHRVRAVDAANNAGPYSNVATASTQGSAGSAPSAPGTPTATAVSSTQIDLRWTAATDDVGVTGYRVERCTGAGCASYAQIAAPAATSYSDTGLVASTAYGYRVPRSTAPATSAPIRRPRARRLWLGRAAALPWSPPMASMKAAARRRAMLRAWATAALPATRLGPTPASSAARSCSTARLPRHDQRLPLFAPYLGDDARGMGYPTIVNPRGATSSSRATTTITSKPCLPMAAEPAPRHILVRSVVWPNAAF